MTWTAQLAVFNAEGVAKLSKLKKAFLKLK